MYAKMQKKDLNAIFENLWTKIQSQQTSANPKKKNLQRILMQLWKSLGRENKAKKRLKTTKDGPRDPNAIFRKNQTE